MAAEDEAASVHFNQQSPQLSVPSHIFRRKQSSLWAYRGYAAESVEAHNLEIGSNFQAVLLSSIGSKPFR